MAEDNWFWILLIIVVASGAVTSMYSARQSRLKEAAAEPRRRERERRLCSCSHGYGTHAGTGCRGDVQRKHYDSLGDRNGYEWVKCGCTQFDGERTFSAEEIVRGWSPPEIS